MAGTEQHRLLRERDALLPAFEEAIDNESALLQLVQQPGVLGQHIRRGLFGKVMVFQRHGSPADIAPILDLHFEIAREALGECASQIRRLAK